MHTAFLQQTIVWVWLVMAVAAIAGVFVQFVLSIGRSEYNCDHLALGLLGQQAAFGLLFLTLSAAGHPLMALFGWRILASTSVLLALAALLLSLGLSTRILRNHGMWIFLAASTVFACTFAAASFLLKSGPVFATLPVSGLRAAQVALSFTVIPGLLIFAVLTAYLTSLFASSVQREGLSIEFLDGGIGGGSRIGRVPAAVSYLLGMILTGSVFVMLLMHGEMLLSTPESLRGEAPVPSSSLAAPSSTAPNAAKLPASSGQEPAAKRGE